MCHSGDPSFVHVNLTQLVSTIHNICKVRGSNPGPKKKDDPPFQNQCCFSLRAKCVTQVTLPLST